MRRSRATVTAWLLAASIVVGAVFIAPSAVARRPHRSLCSQHGSETIVRNKHARVYRLPPYIEGTATKERAGTYACLLRSGKTLKLKDTIELVPGRRRPLALRHFALAGAIVAYTQTYALVDVSCTSIVVLDAATRRTILQAPQGCSTDAGFLSLHHVTSLVVNEHGDVAWITEVGRRSAESFQVHVAVPGSDRLVDAGKGIGPESLLLAPGGEITWFDGGRAMYAPL